MPYNTTEKALAYAKRYRAANPERAQGWSSKWVAANLKAARRDPADLSRKVREFQAWQEMKRKGLLPMYEKVGT